MVVLMLLAGRSKICQRQKNQKFWLSSKNWLKPKNHIQILQRRKPMRPPEQIFPTSEARAAFIRLRKAFTKAPIVHHFDPERHIQIHNYASGYSISGVLSQLTSDLSYSDHLTSKNLNPDGKSLSFRQVKWAQKLS